MLQTHVTLSQWLFRYTPVTLRECLQSYTNIVTSMLRNNNKIYVT